MNNRVSKYTKELWDDKDFVLMNVKLGFSFRYASERLKSDREFAIEVLSNNPDSFFYLSKNLQEDTKIIETTILSYLINISYQDSQEAQLKTAEDIKTVAPSLLLDPNFCNKLILQMYPRASHTFFLAMKQHWNENNFQLPADIGIDTAIKMIESNIGYYQYLPKTCKQNPKVIQACRDILQTDFDVLENLDPGLFNDKDFLPLDLALSIVKKDPSLIRYLPQHYLENEKILNEIKSALPNLNTDKKNKVLNAYYSHHSEIAKTLVWPILKANSLVSPIHDLPDWCKKDKDIAKVAMELDPESIQSIDPNLIENILTPELAAKMAKRKPLVLAYLPKSWDKENALLAVVRELSDEWIQEMYSDGKYSPIITEKAITRLFEIGAHDIDLTKRLVLLFQRLPNESKNPYKDIAQDKTFIINSLPHSMFLLKYLDDDSLKDKKVIAQVLIFVKQYGRFLFERLPNVYKRDKEIADAALNEDVQTVRNIDHIVLQDKTFLTVERAVSVVEKDGRLLKYLPGWCKRDSKIVETALAQNPKAIEYVDPVLLEDKTFLTVERAVSIVEKDGTLLRFLPDWCKINSPIVKAAFDQNPEIIKDLDPKLLEKKNDILTVEMVLKVLKDIAIHLGTKKNDQNAEKALNYSKLIPYLPAWCAEDNEIKTALRNAPHAPPETIQTLDTTKHIKIWISKNPDEPLGNIQNLLRLTSETADYPEREIALIYDKTKLSQKGLQKLEKFSATHKIKLITLEDIEQKLITNSIDWKLFLIAKAEINDPNGNLAAASDILRLIAFTLNLGSIYSDLDSLFRCKKQTLLVSDLLLDIQPVGVNNDVFAFPSNPNANRLFNKLKQKIYENYLQKIGNEPISAYLKKRKENIYPQHLQDEVVDTSGPGVLLTVLNWYIKNHYYDEEKLGINTYGKDPTITHPQHTILGGDAKDVSIVMGKDASWVSRGVENLKNINEAMQKAGKIIATASLNFLAEKKKRMAPSGQNQAPKKTTPKQE